jgi:hypothetical protein
MSERQTTERQQGWREGVFFGRSAFTSTLDFVRIQKWSIITASILLLIPCFWHGRIEAGDLGSHLYNAWLGQLIEKGQAPGLYFAKQWNNILFDLALLKFGNIFGLLWAEKLAVAASVLVFFWGSFTLIAAMSHRAPWFLLPCIAMLTYGWTFNVGFFNYYLSLGLGFFATAIFWRGRGWELIVGVALSALVLLAHPQGFAWLAACVIYIRLWKHLPELWKLLLPTTAFGLVWLARGFLYHHYESYPIWDSFSSGVCVGNDQIALYGMGSYILSGIALIFGVACFLNDGIRRWWWRDSWQTIRLPFELYVIVVFAVYALPDSLRVPFYAGWVGALAARMTAIAAVLGLCVMASMRPRIWHTFGFTAIAAAFFLLLYQDTRVLNRMEQQAERLLSSLPPWERVTARITAPSDSRLPYIGHIVDEACIGRCFSFQNYEAASGQFRIRAKDGNPIVTTDPDDGQSMEAGEYSVQTYDLPMAHVYQCDANDWTQLCIRELSAGEANGRLDVRPKN